MARLRTSRLASLGVLLCVCLMGSAFAQERFAREVAFDIAAQSVEAALLEFSKQADVQVMVGTSSLNGQKTAGVKGKLAVKDALRELLKNTGLEYRTEGNGTITIRSASAAKTDARVRPLMNGSSLASRDAAGEAATRDRASADESAAPTMETLDEVLVTGSHIRGVAPAGSSLIEISRADIEKTGFATVQEVVRSLPQNFSGGPSESTRPQLAGTGDAVARTNATNGTALNLRGLGAGATLVLLNGRRLPSGGTAGLFVDVSSVPLSAVERIDVLTDGASAIYGSDAIGGVVNFVLRKDYDGAETQARVGSVTNGAAKDYQFSQLFGSQWSGGSGLISYEYYQRDALPAAERDQSSDSDLRRFGGSNFDLQNSNPGTIAIGPQTWAIPADQDGTALQPTDFVAGTRNLTNTRTGMDLLGLQKKHSVFGAVGQQIGENWEVFADGHFTQRDAETQGPGQPTILTVSSANPFYVNPTGGTGPIQVHYNFFRDIGGLDSESQVKTYQTTAGATVGGLAGWHITAYGQFGREKQNIVADEINPVALNSALADPNPSTAFNPFGDGSFTNPTTLAAIPGHRVVDSTSDISAGNVIADGPLFDIPGGPVRLAIGGDHRRESFEFTNTPPAGPAASSSYDRTVTSEFVELFVPLVGDENARAGMRRLELSLAGRHENYSDFGSTTNPRFGIAWAPLASLTIRGTWGKSFKAPYLSDLDEANNVSFILPVIDPQSPTGFSPALLASGGNEELKEERATAWTANVEFAPPAISGLRVGLTYFDIDYTGRIAPAPFTFTWLQQPEFADIVLRDPTPAQRDAFCSEGTFAGNFGGGSPDCRTAEIAAIVDLRNNNAAITRDRGLDLLASYTFEQPFGIFNVALNGTRLREFTQATRSASPLIDLLDTPGNPLKTRIRGSVSWTFEGLSSTAFANYANSYRDNATVPNRSIDSWTTIDLQLAYQGENGSFLDGIRIALNAQNLFDKEPPFFNNPAGIGYDPTNAELRGRFISLTLQKKW